MPSKKSCPAENFKKYKIKHIPKNNGMLKTQDMNQWQDEFLVKTAIFWLYFKVILRLNENDFEIKPTYHSLDQKNFLVIDSYLEFSRWRYSTVHTGKFSMASRPFQKQVWPAFEQSSLSRKYCQRKFRRAYGAYSSEYRSLLTVSVRLAINVKSIW